MTTIDFGTDVKFRCQIRERLLFTPNIMEKSFTALAARIFVIREEIHIFTSFLFVLFFFVSSSLKFLPFLLIFTFRFHEKCRTKLDRSWDRGRGQGRKV